MEASTTATVEQSASRKKSGVATLRTISIIVLLIIFYNVFGFFTIQPIGAIPDGVTLFVIRAGTKLQFFDSADAMCERTMGGVNLFCRGAALSSIAENKDMILLRLPYIEMFYLASTGGTTYGR